MEFIINDFDTPLLHSVSLTDTMPLEMDSHPNSLSGLRAYSLGYDLSGCDALACTFTLPLDAVYKTVTDTSFSSTGRMKQVKKNLLVRDMSQSVQWSHLHGLIDKWLHRLATKFRFYFHHYQIYPEFTKNGLIHAHGLLYHDCGGYVSGRCAIFASEWCYISKSSIRATTKYNAFGKIDYAFAKCTNVPKWLEYIEKEYHSTKNNPILTSNA